MKAQRTDFWSVRDLARLLIEPDIGERFSPATESGRGVLVLDLAAGSELPAESDRAAILDILPTLPCVTVAIAGHRMPEPLEAMARACDVLLHDGGEVGPFLSAFERTPVSALAFVQLLRKSLSTSIQAGLVAESFAYSTLQAGREFQDWLARYSSSRSGRHGSVGAPSSGGIGGAAEPNCRIVRDGARLRICLNRRDRHNAFSRAMRDELVEALGVAIADASIREVVLAGDGPSFCSGGDLDEFGTFLDPAQAHVVRITRSPAWSIARLAGRIRTEVQGACIGAGIELPAFTDHIVANGDARFRLPEIGLGLVPGAGGTVSLPRRIGRQRTAWLGLSGRTIDAETALDWGLVDEVRLGQHLTTEGQG
ncbi:MAG TPA: enoyl-CoA hydratase/isomerase family protein [Deltaproteobacteria bacterium]|nr:enoyl-CoA hydratase/isomerase family protein [Deltaproteobacteria bacterium]